MKTLSNRIQIVPSFLSVQNFFNELIYTLLNQNFLSMLVYTWGKKKKRTKLFLLKIRFIMCKQMSFPV